MSQSVDKVFDITSSELWKKTANIVCWVFGFEKQILILFLSNK